MKYKGAHILKYEPINEPTYTTLKGEVFEILDRKATIINGNIPEEYIEQQKSKYINDTLILPTSFIKAIYDVVVNYGTRKRYATKTKIPFTENTRMTEIGGYILFNYYKPVFIPKRVIIIYPTVRKRETYRIDLPTYQTFFKRTVRENIFMTPQMLKFFKEKYISSTIQPHPTPNYAMSFHYHPPYYPPLIPRLMYTIQSSNDVIFQLHTEHESIKVERDEGCYLFTKNLPEHLLNQSECMTKSYDILENGIPSQYSMILHYATILLYKPPVEHKIYEPTEYRTKFGYVYSLKQPYSIATQISFKTTMLNLYERLKKYDIKNPISKSMEVLLGYTPIETPILGPRGLPAIYNTNTKSLTDDPTIYKNTELIYLSPFEDLLNLNERDVDDILNNFYPASRAKITCIGEMW